MALTFIEKAGMKTGNKYVDFTTGLLADMGSDPTISVGAGLAKAAGKLGSKFWQIHGDGRSSGAQLWRKSNILTSLV
ncbi:hypothetical protein CW304_13580 [Bacillus sp. UFRGS-B20]|nr:hypothetical protein CW304_13580 [Bacillus sp. UFRGS-B20]